MNPSWILRLSCAATLAAHLIAALAIAEQPARRGGPDRIKAGDRAPDFTLKSPDGKQTVTLSSFRDEKPVALIFGSYTWPPFRHQAGALDRLYEKYGDRVEFLMVYIREAHAVDGRQSPRNETEAVLFLQPIDLAERVEVCQEMCTTLKIKIPPVIDKLDDRVNQAYNAAPDRLYLVGKDGRIAYQGDRGPRGFRPAELEAAIEQELRTE